MQERTSEKCRGCGVLLPMKSLITYRNMPKSAQNFPDKASLSQDMGVDIVVKECPYCGLVQIAGEPVSYFRDVIRATGVSKEMRDFRIQQYGEWVKKYGLNEKRVIEIGCGHGEYMDMMEKSGAIVFGLEHRPESILEGKVAGHKIFEGFLETDSTKIAGMPYDGFYCMNFLEHIPNLGVFLRGLSANLIENAYGLIEVPNFDMTLKKSLYSEFIQDHLSYFTSQSLENVLRQNGFNVLSIKSIWHDYTLSAEVQKREGVDISGFSRKQEDLRKQITYFLKQQHDIGRKVAVWGAGHRTLANLSLLNMQDKIECVIDSAEFKQGMYTPATHIPIYSPQILLSGHIQMVIIMVDGYFKEVKKIMDREYPDVKSVIFSDRGIEY